MSSALPSFFGTYFPIPFFFHCILSSFFLFSLYHFVFLPSVLLFYLHKFTSSSIHSFPSVFSPFHSHVFSSALHTFPNFSLPSPFPSIPFSLSCVSRPYHNLFILHFFLLTVPFLIFYSTLLSLTASFYFLYCLLSYLLSFCLPSCFFQFLYPPLSVVFFPFIFYHLALLSPFLPVAFLSSFLPHCQDSLYFGYYYLPSYFLSSFLPHPTPFLHYSPPAPSPSASPSASPPVKALISQSFRWAAWRVSGRRQVNLIKLKWPGVFTDLPRKTKGHKRFSFSYFFY